MNLYCNKQISNTLKQALINEAAKTLLGIVTDCFERNWNSSRMVYIDKDLGIRWLSNPNEHTTMLGSISSIKKGEPTEKIFDYYVNLISSRIDFDAKSISTH